MPHLGILSFSIPHDSSPVTPNHFSVSISIAQSITNLISQTPLSYPFKLFYLTFPLGNLQCAKMHIAFYKKTARLLAQPLTYSFLCNCSSGQIFTSMSQHNLNAPHRRI